jgi:hypothetical protein
MTAGHCRDSAIGSRLPIYARHAARLGDGGARGRSAASPGGIGVRADRCRSAVLGSSKSGPSRNGFWPATRQGCTPSSRSRDSLLGRSTLPHQEGDHAGAGRGGVAGGALPMSAGTSFHGRRKPNGSACHRGTMAGVQDEAKHAIRTPTPQKPHEPPVLDVGQPDPDRRRNLIWGLQTDALFFTRAERRREAFAGFCGRMT